MTVEPQDAAGPPPPPSSGRPTVYPYATMAVGQMFFIAGRSANTAAPHAYKQGRKLGRKFSTRLQWMRKTPHGWEYAVEGEEGAVLGVGIYRVK